MDDNYFELFQQEPNEWKKKPGPTKAGLETEVWFRRLDGEIRHDVPAVRIFRDDGEPEKFEIGEYDGRSFRVTKGNIPGDFPLELEQLRRIPTDW